MAVIKMEWAQRKNTRLKGYDYSNSGYYFITICTHKRKHLLGSIVDSKMLLNRYGKIVQDDLLQIPEKFLHVKLDKFIIMPNHIHCIIIIGHNIEHLNPPNMGDIITDRSRPIPTIPKILGLYKSGTTRKIHELKPEIIIWQKSYYDHIIRNQQDYQNIWKYIDTNPLKWQDDIYF